MRGCLYQARGPGIDHPANLVTAQPYASEDPSWFISSLHFYNEMMPQRTQWAEQFAEMFASLPLVREWVFRGPRRLDRGVEKEICDLLVSLRSEVLVLQMKCRENPGARSDEKAARWVLKHADTALSQIKGAIRCLKADAIWCDHPRRGRVAFKPGELRPLHGIVLVEHWGDQVSLPVDFALEYGAVPIAYFAVNDFLNVINELRAFPEIVSYPQRRAALPSETRRMIGTENVLFLYYLLHGFTFDGWTNYDQAARSVDLIADPRSVILGAREGEEGAYLLEAVADALNRAADYFDGLPADLAQGFDPPTRRENYLRMQENICDLSLQGRKLLGQRLWETIHRLRGDQDEDMNFVVGYVPYKPDFLYVLAAAKGLDRPTLLRRGLYSCGAVFLTLARRRSVHRRPRRERLRGCTSQRSRFIGYSSR